jgi:hypothetical protein
LGSFWEGGLVFLSTPLISPRTDIPAGFGTYLINNGERFSNEFFTSRYIIRLLPAQNPDSPVIWELIPANYPTGQPFPYGEEVEGP